MSWQQLIVPKVPWPYAGGWCQGFVEGSFGQASAPQKDAQGNWYTVGPFPSAKAAWDANYGGGRHPNELPPKGIAVPVYFTLGSTTAGHVAISMPDGTVLSSTQGGWHSAGTVHPNLQDLINVYAKYNDGCSYLGWQEYVGKVQVVKKEEVVRDPSKDEVNAIYIACCNRSASAAEIANYTQHPFDVCFLEVYNSPESIAWRKKANSNIIISSSDAEANLNKIKEGLGLK